MAVLWQMENPHTIIPECPITIQRATKADVNIDVETPCEGCLYPYEGCNTLHASTTLVIKRSADWSFTGMSAAQQAVWNAIVADLTTTYNSGLANCHWTAERTDDQEDYAVTLDSDITVTLDGSHPGKLSLSLAVNIVSTGDMETDTTITYTDTNVDPWLRRTLTMSTSSNLAARTVDLTNGYGLVFPAQLSVILSPP